MRILSELILLFFIFSVLGWVMEVVLKYIKFKRFINRGFLIGPYCPIYGYGVLFITVVIGGLFKTDGPLIVTFLLGLVLCGIIEYITSWYLEYKFHARWWDYSNKPFNINGRVWIGNLILFGLAAVLILHIVDPFYFKLVDKLSNGLLYSLAIIVLIIYLSDVIISHFLMGIVKESVESANGDNTEEISNEVRNMLKDKNLLVKRLTKAYPDAMARPSRLVNELKKAKAHYKQKVSEFKRLEKEYKQKKFTEIEEKLNILKEHKEEARLKYEEIKGKFKKNLK